MATVTDIRWTIRPFRAGDLPACKALYRDGLISGVIAANDTGVDIDDIGAAYMNSDGHFWVAELVEPPDSAPPAIVGMIGVQQFDGVAEIRRLRVAASYRRRGIGSNLVETAVRFCHEHSSLKITLDTFVEREPALKLFEKFRFRHDRTRQVSGRELLYFYRDLYTSDEKPHRSDSAGSIP
jgi:ribosomal protein S18 acetylase RimI-like enzyme